MTLEQAFDAGWTAALKAHEQGNVDMHAEIRKAVLREQSSTLPSSREAAWIHSVEGEYRYIKPASSGEADRHGRFCKAFGAGTNNTGNVNDCDCQNLLIIPESRGGEADQLAAALEVFATLLDRYRDTVAADDDIACRLQNEAELLREAAVMLRQLADLKSAFNIQHDLYLEAETELARLRKETGQQ